MSRDAAAVDRIHRVMTDMLLQGLSEREALAEIVAALEAAGRRLLEDAPGPANDNKRQRA